MQHIGIYVADFHVLPYVDAASRHHLARASRLWWRLLFRAWYAELHARRRWRRLRRALPRPRAEGAYQIDNPYMSMDMFTPDKKMALGALMGMAARLRMPECDLLPHLCCHFGRWALLQRWVGGARLPPALLEARARGRLDAQLAKKSDNFWNLAQYTDMNMRSTGLEWWAFCRVWRDSPVARDGFQLEDRHWGHLEAVCREYIDDECMAMLGVMDHVLELGLM